jgi:hypothetical protein
VALTSVTTLSPGLSARRSTLLCVIAAIHLLAAAEVDHHLGHDVAEPYVFDCAPEWG